MIANQKKCVIYLGCIVVVNDAEVGLNDKAAKIITMEINRIS